MQLGVLVSFLLYSRNFFHPIQELSQVYNVFQAAAAALEKLSGLLDEKPSVPEPPEERAVTRAAWGGRIDFEDVTFGYRDRNILEHVTLEIPAAQTVALVGPTGAGKTTIARLVARFYDPNHGPDRRSTVSTCATCRRAELRKAIVMVTQENFLFSGTRRRQHRLRSADATREEIERAAARRRRAHRSSRRCPTATTRTSASAADVCRPGSGSSSRSRGRSSPTPR